MGATLNLNVTANPEERHYNSPALNDSLNNPGTDNTETVQETPPISLGNGIQEKSETGNVNETTKTTLEDKPPLPAPASDILDIFMEPVPLTPEMQKVLGVDVDSMSSAELMLSCAEKLFGKLNKSLDKIAGNDEKLTSVANEMTGDDIALLCLLLCQESKSVLVKTLKATLSSKTKQRAALNDECMKKQKEIAEKQAKQIKEAEKAKVRGIFKAILGVVGAIVGVVVSALAIAATGGIAGPALSFAIAGLVLSSVSAVCAATSAGLTIGAMYTENEDIKKKLNTANMVIGIVGALAGVAGSVCSGTALCKMQDAIEGVSKAIKLASDIASGVSSVGSGALDIADGAINIESAKVQRSIANLKIEMEKLDQNIETLSQMIDQVTEDLQQFIKNILECEQMVANELRIMMETLTRLAEQKA